MHPMLNTAVKAARQAGNIIMRHVDRIDQLTIESKGRHDFVTEIDRNAELAIIEIIRSTYPGHAIIAEESGQQPGEDYEWIIDPLDGTTNFLHGFPQFAVSICVRKKGVLDQAVIFDPIKNELFTASRGQGAQINSRRLRVSTVSQMSNTLLATGFPVRQPEHMDAWIKMFSAILPRTSGIRRAGSAALDLAYVAAGRFDGFWEIGLQSWDMAAGCLLIQEAGGMTGDFLGGQKVLDSGNIIAGNPDIYPQLLRLIGPHVTAKLSL